MWIVRLALRRPYTVAVLSALIFIAGLLSVTRMRTDIFPSIDIPVVVGVWKYPGLSAEDMERNVVIVRESEELRAGTRALVDRAVEMARRLMETRMCAVSIERGGRKAHAAPPQSPGNP